MGHETKIDSEKSLKKQENINDCAVLQKFPTLNIHTENSFVKIGDEFNFSKPVLIVVPDELRQSETKNEDTPSGDSFEENSTNRELNRSRTRLFGDRLFRYRPSTTHKALFALIFVLAVGLLLVITLNVNTNADRRFEIPDFVSRSLWESQPRKCAYSRLEKPASLVIIQHTTGTFCCNFSECQQSVKNSQNWHLSLPYYCDVRFGFLVGGDCRIYEGRNFSLRESMANDPFSKSSVEVAFIGDFSRDQPLDCQIDTFLRFINNSVSAGYLDRDFRVVGALQVYSYEPKSPGKNLMDRIQQWPTWINETLHPAYSR